MSKKTYCDFCGKEITEPGINGIDFSTTLRRIDEGMPTRISVQILFTTDAGQTRFDSDICPTCMWEVIDRIDPRPKMAASANASS